MSSIWRTASPGASCSTAPCLSQDPLLSSLPEPGHLLDDVVQPPLSSALAVQDLISHWKLREESCHSFDDLLAESRCLDVIILGFDSNITNRGQNNFKIEIPFNDRLPFFLVTFGKTAEVIQSFDFVLKKSCAVPESFLQCFNCCLVICLGIWNQFSGITSQRASEFVAFV